jgi:hypothetical protein
MKAEIKGDKKNGLWIIVTDNKNNLITNIPVEEKMLEPILVAIEDYLESKDL